MPPLPVRVIAGLGAFWQTDVPPFIDADGKGLTVTVAVCPVIALVQKAAFAFSTLVILYSKIPTVFVGTGIKFIRVDVIMGVCATAALPLVESV